MPPPLIWHHPEPPGRKNALTRAAVVRTAIEVADAGGVAALTMRAVADALGVSTPMSLYRYVLNKDGLVDLMLDEVSAEVGVPSAPSADWRGDLRGLATSLWAMIGRHRWYAELVDSRPPFGPRTVRRAAFLMTVLDWAGLAPAVAYASLLDNYVTGTAMSVSRELGMLGRFGIGSTADLVSYAAEMADGPLAPWLHDMPDLTADSRFELGLDCLLDGFARRRR
ncbi:TetR family transcriptional regulator [Amycolatopsis balhimycina DSM 5908]|uniref:TetR family transcriptional regulator n=1 Tax=Amycolatopsis balhimycina DSM 5908 TaxID=1081091 RepID=A0A428VZY5_AMYBA|nr:TetR/AcrR family transcriptional regulator C-terminal domain-containing protein [Amycolatopsis balhimycina]RSM36361.1 TetR family transcriptional regulator [Amycolatopsis balhimycina DSM 5908]